MIVNNLWVSMFIRYGCLCLFVSGILIESDILATKNNINVVSITLFSSTKLTVLTIYVN